MPPPRPHPRPHPRQYPRHALTTLTCLLAGCTPAAPQATTQPHPAPANPTNPSAQPQTPCDCLGDPNRLKEDLPRTLKQLRWAKLSLERVEPGDPVRPSTSRFPEEDEGKRLWERQHWRLTALLPDDRGVEVVTRAMSPQSIRVTAKVGLLGDPAQERAFCEALAAVLRRPAMPIRWSGFHLPEP